MGFVAVLLVFKDLTEVISYRLGDIESFPDREVKVTVLNWTQVNVLLNQLHLLVLVIHEHSFVFDHLLVIRVRVDPLSQRRNLLRDVNFCFACQLKKTFNLRRVVLRPKRNVVLILLRKELSLV
jgi:hypothetical protein